MVSRHACPAPRRHRFSDVAWVGGLRLQGQDPGTLAAPRFSGLCGSRFGDGVSNSPAERGRRAWQVGDVLSGVRALARAEREAEVAGHARWRTVFVPLTID